MSLHQIDRNIQTLRHIDGSWSLPAIPDEVRLDLATLPGVGPADIESLLYGMESELEVAQAPIPQQIDVQGVDVAQIDFQMEGQPDPEPMRESLTRWYGGALMGGQGRPQVLDPDAVRLWKEEATRKGYVELTPEQMEDPRWYPEYNVVNRRMASDRLTSGFTGGREGALSIEETANIFDNFAPSGLMRAMTEWDLSWDYNKIGHEWSDWVPKYKRLLYHLQAIPFVPDVMDSKSDPSPDGTDGGYASWKTPIALLDAMTGPIDDVALPVLNWLVIGAGLAGISVGVGGLLVGAQTMRATGLFRAQQATRQALGPVGRAFITDQPFVGAPGMAGAQFGSGAAQGATRLTNFGRPSGISSWATGAMGKSTRFGGRMAPPAQAAGRGMQAWRNTRAVQAAKLANQQLVLRPGLMARGELATGHGGDMPGEGGWSLNEVGIVHDLRQQYGYFMNPDGSINKTNFLGDIAYDILFTPYTIFEPGTIKSVMRGFQVVGHQGVRAASATFPFVRRRFAAFGEAGGRATNAFYGSMADFLKRNPNGDERYPQMSKDFEKTAKETSLDNAFSEHFFAGDKAEWGKAKMWHFYTIGIEHAARQAARLVGVEPTEWQPLYKAIENKLYAQTHALDPHDAMEYIAHVSRDATKATVVGAKSDADAVGIMRRQLLEQALESPQTTGLRGTSVGKGYVRLVEEMDPESGWTYWRKLRDGETPAGGARITDVNIEELAAGRGTSLDEARRFLDDPLEEGVQGLVLPPGFEGANRTFTWDELTTGTARRWDPAKIKMFWDPAVVTEGKKYRGIVHNHNDARDATIADVINNLESGSPALSEGMHARIPNVSGLPAQTPRVQGAFGDLPAVTEGLTDDVLERLTNWTGFEQASTELHDAVARGGLMDAMYEKALSESGRRLNLFPFSKDYATGRRTPAPYGGHLLGYAVDSIDYNYVTWINSGMYKPLVRSIDPGQGRVTLARLGSLVKQEAIEFAAQVTYRAKLLKGVKDLRLQPYWDDLVTEAGRFVQSTPIESVKQGTIREWLDDLIKRGMLKTTSPTGIHDEAHARIRRLVEYGMRNGKNLDDLEVTLTDELGKWALRPEWVNRFGLDPILVDGGGDLVKMARRRALDLQKASSRIAAKIDPDSLPPYLVKHLEDQGYMAVHGVEFADPRRLGRLIPELDMDTQFINNKLTLGLSRQNPYWLSTLRMRTAKSALAGHLAEAFRRLGKLEVGEYTDEAVKGTRVDTSGKLTAAKGIRAEFQGGDPNSGAVTDLIKFLNGVVRSINEKNMALLDEMGYGYRMAAPVEGISTKLKLSRTPYSVPDLSMLPYNRVREALVDGGNYSEDEFRAIWNALKASRKLEGGSTVRGLAHMEDYLRSKNTATSVLSVLSRHEAGRFLTPGKFRHGAVSRGLPFVTGFAGSAGAAIDAQDRHPEDSKWGNRFRSGVAGAVGFMAGRGAGNMALRGGLKARPVMNQVADLDVLREKGFLKTWRPGGPAWRSPDDVFNYTDWQRYAHLSDFGANMRDYFRFSLNPVFDISRYVEGMVLSQVVGADVAKGLKLNQGPQSYQKMMARRIRTANPGMDLKSAQVHAREEWKRVRSAFMDVAHGRGDFQWENIENMSQWFTSVGIMGFSPQNWMASTFGQLMEAGIDAEKAYEISRKTYTYGMTGRSAAEQSVNFVWFPFSFMKKTVGHFAEWMGSDLTRGVLLHDMVKAYELVDERYDLHDRWRDYLPILEKIRRINLFGYGLSPGEFGGMNAPLIRGVWHNPLSEMIGGSVRGTAKLVGAVDDLDVFKDPIVAMLMPQALSAPPDADEGWWDDVQTLIKRVMPLLSDFSHLLEDIMQQGQVVGRALPGGQAALHDEAQIQHAWQEWDEYRQGIVKQLTEGGISWSSFLRKETTYRGKKMSGSDFVAAKRAELLEKYPAWADSQSGSASSDTKKNLELLSRRENATIPADTAVAEFVQVEELAKQYLRANKYSTTDPIFMPPFIHIGMREAAIELVKIYPDFLPIYNRLWSRDYGPITTEVR